VEEAEAPQEPKPQQHAPGHQSASVEDPTTTNIFISNLSPKTNEQELMHKFGHYGLLASVKIMWPRTEDEKARNANCGFVAYMNRKDAEQGLAGLDATSVNGQMMRLSWSKAITLPNQPVYIPPELVEVTIPPPPSGLPFNAQPLGYRQLRRVRRQARRRHSHSSSSSSSSDSSTSSDSQSEAEESASDDFTKVLRGALVKVVIPTDKGLLALIHRTVEFVALHGAAFEAMVMARETANPQFRFLFDNQSPAHTYYRWRLFSVLHGESRARWRTRPFRMFAGGSFWQPPPLNRYTQGMPDEAYEAARRELDTAETALGSDRRDRLEEMLRAITTERKSVAEAMRYCIENADKAEEVVECVAESLLIAETPLNVKVARLYLVSDILHNCCAKVANASYYRRGLVAFCGLSIAVATSRPQLVDSLLVYPSYFSSELG